MTARSGVGLCLHRDGAVVAVIHADTYRVLAVADLGWPTAGPAARVLARARRRLHLPRRERVAVVQAPEVSTVDSTGLLSRARLVEAGVVTPNRAARLGSSVDIAANPRFAEVAGSRLTVLAVGAALAGLLDYPVRPAAHGTAAPPAIAPPAIASPAIASPVPGIDAPHWIGSAWPVPDGPGWLVQRIDPMAEPVAEPAAEPAASVAAKAR